MSPVRVIVVDDEQLVRHALRAFIAADERVELVAEATDGAEAVDACRSYRSDVVLMDLKMPKVGGIEAMKRIAAAELGCRVLALTGFSTEWRVIDFLRAGGCGYLVKDSTPDEIIDAILAAHAGERVVSPVVRPALAGNGTALARSLAQKLTAREIHIIERIAEGLSNAEIADELHYSEATVKADINSVNHKWGVSNRLQIVLRAVDMGVVRL